MGQAEEEIPVLSHDQQAFRILIEPAGGIYSREIREIIHDRGAPFRIRLGGHDPPGFMKQKGPFSDGRLNARTIECKGVHVGIEQTPQITEHLPVQGNTALEDCSLSLAPAHDSGRSYELVCPLFFHE